MIDDEVLRDFARDGFVGPVAVLEPADCDTAAAAVRASLASAAARSRAAAANRHLEAEHLHRLASHPRLVSLVTAVLGAEPSLWASEIWSRDPGSDDYTPWHQDAPFWPVPGIVAVSVWLALSPSDAANGGLAVAVGSHRSTFAYVANGDPRTAFDQCIPAGALAAYEVIWPRFEAGDALVTDPNLAHAAEANRGDGARLAVSFRYASAERLAQGRRAVTRPAAAGLVPVILGWEASG